MSSSPVLSNTSIVNELQASAIYRRIPNEIAEFGQILQKYKEMNDPLSNAIKDWYQEFTKALQSDSNRRDVINLNMYKLEELLTDPVGKLIDDKLVIPFDDHALLGSDGHTYGFKSLQILLSEIPVQYHKRSPSDFNDPAPFFVKPHFLVREAVKWLIRFNKDFYPEIIEAYFQELKNNNQLPELPMEAPANPHPFSLTLLSNYRYGRQDLYDLSLQLTQIKEEEIEALHEDMEEIQKQIEREFNEDMKLLAELEAKIELVAPELKENIELIKHEYSVTHEELRLITDELVQTQKKIVETEKETEKLEQSTVELKRKQEELRNRRSEMHKKARKKGRRRMWVKIVAAASLSYGCSFIVPFLSGGTVSTSAIPTDYGLKFISTF